jgi:mRNA interferase MazF
MLPDAGDIAWVELGETLGTEQYGRRPALILTSLIYHEVSSRAVVCPITSTDKPWASNVRLPAGLKTTGFVLLDQLRAVDRRHRMFDVVERIPQVTLIEVHRKLASLLGIEILDLVAAGSGRESI